jgi:NADH dehydrogenase
MTERGDAPGAHRVVIVGSGFGGLFAARRLRRAPVDVTVIDRTNHHLFQPLLYQVATGILSEGEIAPATRDVLRRFSNVAVQLGTVTGVDLRARTVTATLGDRVFTTPYDSLIVATGIETSYFGHDEFGRWASGMKSIDDALELRGRIFGAFESAELETDEVSRDAWLTFVVVGAGPTGVELAGQIAELSRRSLHRNFRAIDPASARVVLVEGGPAVLPSFGSRLSRIAERDVRRIGVELRLNTMVTGMDRSGVDLRTADGGSERIAARTAVWAAGMTASPLGAMLAAASGAALDRMGRVMVKPDCSLPGHSEVFVVGDLMALGDLPGMAEVALQSGQHAAATIHRRAMGDDAPRPFRYYDLGSLATISRFNAVARIGPLRFGGLAGWVVWLVVHLTLLTGFKNRLGALAHWTISFLGRGRAERTITEQQVIARRNLERGGDGSERWLSGGGLAGGGASDGGSAGGRSPGS